MKSQVVLASASPRRRELLSLVLDAFIVKTSEVDESEFLVDASTGSIIRAALAKARDVAEGFGAGSIIIGSDTVISFMGQLLGKPEDEAHAEVILKHLRGEVHEVITGVAILGPSSSQEYLFHESTRVRMKDYTDREIQDYIASGEPMDKAGAYAIQGIGRKLVHSIKGCYPNVVGFPLCAVVKYLNLAGVETRSVPAICPSRLARGTCFQLV
jgi:nucleoside triphosphate pyrophosphatase